MAKKLIAALIAAGLVVGLTACGDGLSPEELAQAKADCEALGGEFDQWKDGMYYEWHSDCIFDGGKERR